MSLSTNPRMQKAASELHKALTATGTPGTSGASLHPEDLEPALVEELLLLQPLLTIMPTKQATARIHEITRRTAHGSAAWEGELVDDRANAVASTYDRPTVTLQPLHFWGAVSGFQQSAANRFIDSYIAEQQGGLEALSNQFEFMVLWGNNVDTYIPSGFDAQITTHIFDVDGVATLKVVDDMIDAATGYRGAERDPAILLMSKGMATKVGGLQTLARRQAPTVEFEGALRFNTYRGVPIVETDYLKPAAAVISDLTAVKLAGGSLADDEYFYRIAAVHPNGEVIASNEDSDTTSAADNSVTLAWTADPDALLYKIYRGLTAGEDNLNLLAVIAAKTRDANGKISGTVATYIDLIVANPSNNEQPYIAGDESIFYVNLNPDRGAAVVSLVDALGSRVDNLISFIELARTRSSLDFMFESFAALQIPWEKLHAKSRRVRLT